MNSTDSEIGLPRTTENTMYRPESMSLVVGLLCALASLIPGGCSHGAEPVPGEELSPVEKRLGELVAELREAKKLVGLAAMVTVDGQVVASAVDGQRRKGSGVALEIGDNWHVGSITKSATATLIARLIERGRLDWSTTVGDCFEESMSLHSDWKSVTMEQLLTHTSGAPANFPITVQFQAPPEGAERLDARRKAVAQVLAKPAKSKPGTAFGYSNVGYVIAAAMAEAEMELPWEELMRSEVLRPLEMSRAGFGPPKDPEDALGQPRGHQNVLGFKRTVGQDDDNSPIIGPAGTLNMTLAELCIHGNEHLRGERGAGRLLKQETYQRLHTPKLAGYAHGWVVQEKSPWTGGRVLWHNGSNTMWYALVAIVPELNVVVAVTSNDGDIPRAEAAAIAIVKETVELLSKDE